MKVDEARTLAALLTERLKGITGPDGHPLEFIVTHPWRSSKATDYSIKDKRMVTKTNLLSGKPFEIEEDTPAFMDPSTETYHSM